MVLIAACYMPPACVLFDSMISNVEPEHDRSDIRYFAFLYRDTRSSSDRLLELVLKKTNLTFIQRQLI